VSVIVEKFRKRESARVLRRLESIAREVNQVEEPIRSLTDSELKGQTSIFRARLAEGEDLDLLLPEAFATVREAAWRVLGQRHYDVQVMGGVALHTGNIAEMATGEGKTLVATLSAYLNALPGLGVHVVTVNQYLAERDADWMGQVYHFLGLKVGVLRPDMTVAERQEAYQADITYGTNNEFGFDYLRDNMAFAPSLQVQRGFNYVIVDEADSILIDEARTPLIISGPVPDTSLWHKEFANIVSQLIQDVDYRVDVKDEGVGITDAGVSHVEKILGVGNLYSAEHAPLLSFLQNAMKAKELYKRDVHYIVGEGGEVLLIDPHTGRVMHGRRFNDGLHQALEAKEGVEVQEETQVYASISLQNYFRMYRKLSGMTGTADTEASEFESTYGLGVVPIPTHRPKQRVDFPDKIYRTALGRDQAVLAEVIRRHHLGQPILIGTADVGASERCSEMLDGAGIPHTVLNAKQNATEASVISQAGRLGAVTVATNMAGRGTDILLGGDPTLLATETLIRQGVVRGSEDWETAWPDALSAAKREAAAEAETIRALGGLCVIGMDRHESRRIDNQLRGRAGRQGDPGETCFFLSLEDRMLQVFNTDVISTLLKGLNTPDTAPIELKAVNSAIQSAQAQQEGSNFALRKSLLNYDEVVNRQRNVIYRERAEVLKSQNLFDQVCLLVEEAAKIVVVDHYSGYSEGSVDMAALWEKLREIYPIQEKEAFVDRFEGSEAEEVSETVAEDAVTSYRYKRSTLPKEDIDEAEKLVILRTIDQHWRDHLFEMDYLRQGISLRAWGSRNPQVEYASEGYKMFQDLMSSIRVESVRLLFQLEASTPPNTEGGKGLTYSGPSEPGATLGGGESAKAPSGGRKASTEETVSAAADTEQGAGDDREFTINPNDLCYCESGRKYKRCHGSLSKTRVE